MYVCVCVRETLTFDSDLFSPSLTSLEDASLILDEENAELKAEDWAKILEISTQKKYGQVFVLSFPPPFPPSIPHFSSFRAQLL